MRYMRIKKDLGDLVVCSVQLQIAYDLISFVSSIFRGKKLAAVSLSYVCESVHVHHHRSSCLTLKTERVTGHRSQKGVRGNVMSKRFNRSLTHLSVKQQILLRLSNFDLLPDSASVNDHT